MATIKRDQRRLEWVPTESIIKNERNPRSEPSFTDAELTQLRDSIMQHGIIEPLIVQAYDNDQYLLIEGERRWTVAKREGIKEVPVTIVNRLEGDDQVVLMYNLHENRRGWEMADQLRAIQELMDNRPELDEEALAKELGIALPTFRNRLQVLQMGPAVLRMIQRGEIDYSSALRSNEAARTISKRRPEAAKELGGEKRIERQLLKKAKARGGISQELASSKQDLKDREHVPDDIIIRYVNETERSLRDLRRSHRPAEDRKAVSDLDREVVKIESEIKRFNADLGSAPNLRRLREHLVALIKVAEELERRIVDAILEAEKAEAQG